MLIINKLKPFYKNTEDKIIRMGNFIETGKEIEYEEDSIFSIFDNIMEPIEKDDLVQIVFDKTKIDKKDIINTIDYLIENDFIIDNDKYEKLIKDNIYNRQDLFFNMFTEEYIPYNDKMKDKNILILGLGGIGSNVAIMLNRAGFNNFTLVDSDLVEDSNLIRQLPYSKEDIGKYKTDVLKEKLKSDNISTKNIYIEKEKDIDKEISKCDFVLCTVDKPLRIIRRLINKICIKYNKPVLFCGFSEYVAIIGPFVVPHKTACLSCIEKEVKDIPLKNVTLTPSYGPICMMISSIVADEIINYFVNYKENNLIGKTLMYNTYTYKTEIIKWDKNNKCEECLK